MSMINFKNHACKTGLSTNILVFSGILRSLRSFSEAFRKYYDIYTAGWEYSRNICMVLFCHTLCFPRYFLETKFSSTPEKNPIWRFLARKMCLISLRALKQQFSKMADAGNIKVPKLFTQLPLLQKTMKILA